MPFAVASGCAAVAVESSRVRVLRARALATLEQRPLTPPATANQLAEGMTARPSRRYHKLPCYHPITAWRVASGRQPNGKWPLTFDIQEGFRDMEVQIPCGQCIGCRLERSRQWAVRCIHEASKYDENIFLTLTYDDEHLPPDGSLDVRDFQLFFKRLRKKFQGQKIRFFHCGEYGEKYSRPHYHAIVFNFCPNDLVPIRNTDHGMLFTSPTIASLWGKGFVTIGAVTFETCAYVARYVVKKQFGKDSWQHYVDGETGLVRAKEYVTMSRRPGIGADWIDKYYEEVFTHDGVLVRGHVSSPPRFYVDRMEKIDPSRFTELKRKRIKKAAEIRSSDDCSPSRMLIREQCRELKIKALHRSFESSGGDNLAPVQHSLSYVEED